MNESEPVNPAWHGAQKPVKNWKQTVSFLEVPLDRFDEFWMIVGPGYYVCNPNSMAIGCEITKLKFRTDNNKWKQTVKCQKFLEALRIKAF